MYYTQEEYDFITSHGREMPTDIAGVRELIEELQGKHRPVPSRPNVILVGNARAVHYAYGRLIAEGHEVAIEQQPMGGKWTITAPAPDAEIMKVAELYYDQWHPWIAKPKHRNGQYNPVNRKKNKASRKARKQNRR